MLQTACLLCLALLVAAPPGFGDILQKGSGHEVTHDTEESHDTEEAHEHLDILNSASSEENLPEEHKKPHLNLEDPASWSASGEVLDENHAWYRRRRSLAPEASTRVQEEQDLEAAESVVFMPAHLRLRKRVAEEECRHMHHQFNTRRRLHPSREVPHRMHCNGHCCYPFMDLE